MYDAIVIGAGIAGIAVALRLRKQGKTVLVLEKNSYVGGKIYHDEAMGYRWDLGPSLFTLPNLVDELYWLFDKNPRDYYDYVQQNESCRYFWEDKTNLIFYSDFQKLQGEVSEKLGANPAN